METFMPVYCKITDQSHLHAGHKEASPNGSTHFHVTIVSDIFENKKNIQRHRDINKTCDLFFKKGLHALAIKALSPSEWEDKNG